MRNAQTVMCIAVLGLAGSLAAAEEAMQDDATGNPERGKELFQSDLGCNVCHGMDAKGAIGPDIRQATIEKVYHALQNFPDMMNWQFNFPELFEEQSLLDVVAYLQTLEKEDAE